MIFSMWLLMYEQESSCLSGNQYVINPLVLFGHFWPKIFLFWIFKNHSFIGTVPNLVTFMAFGMWTHKKKWWHDSSRLSGHKKNSHTCALRSKMTDHRKWMGNRQKPQNSETFCVYNLQIGHNAEKKYTAVKGWHSKTLQVWYRHIHSHKDAHTHTHTHLWTLCL